MNKHIQTISIIIITVGFVIIISFVGILIFGEINFEKMGQIGDFVGGTVGSIWALAGVLLFFLALNFQRKEFQLQREELAESRTEFRINRITNIIYQQLNRFERSRFSNSKENEIDQTN